MTLAPETRPFPLTLSLSKGERSHITPLMVRHAHHERGRDASPSSSHEVPQSRNAKRIPHRTSGKEHP